MGDRALISPRRKKPNVTAKTDLKTPTMVVVRAEFSVVQRKSA